MMVKDKTDKYLANRRKAIGNAIASKKESIEWSALTELSEKASEDSGKKITGKGVNNSKLIKVSPFLKASPNKKFIFSTLAASSLEIVTICVAVTKALASLFSALEAELIEKMNMYNNTNNFMVL